MKKDLVNRFKSYERMIRKNKLYLDNILKNKEICIDIFNDVINKVKETDFTFLDGYELKIVNVDRKSIKSDVLKEESFLYEICEKENLKGDIIFKKENEKLKVGTINCDINIYDIVFENGGKFISIELNKIIISDKYNFDQYISYILENIPSIVGAVYEAKVNRIITTIEFVEFEEYKILEDEYIKKVNIIKKWLKNGYFRENKELIKKINGVPFIMFEMDLSKRINFDRVIGNLRSYIRILGFSIESEDKDMMEIYIKKCDKSINEILKDFYITESKKVKLEKIKGLKNEFIQEYSEKKELMKNQIKILERVIENSNKMKEEKLELDEKDTLNDIIIKSICKDYNLKSAINQLEVLGYRMIGDNGRKHNFTINKIKEILYNGNTKNVKLRRNAIDIIEANRIIYLNHY